MNPAISGLRADHLPGEKSDVVARFDFTYGPFTVRRCAIRQHREHGHLFIATPGRGATGGISINRDGDFWPDLERAALEEFQWLKHH